MLNQLTKIFKALEPDEDKEIYPIWSTGTVTNGWEIVRDFSLTNWGLGISVFGFGDDFTFDKEMPDSKLGISVDLGPWCFSLQRYWRSEDGDL